MSQSPAAMTALSAVRRGAFCFVTLFDHRYFSRGLALYESLQRHSPGSRLYVLALSDECVRLLEAKPQAHLAVIPLAEMEAAMPELLTARANRSLKEYYYTLSSALCHYMIFLRGEEELVTYLDADTYFFSPPDIVFAEIEGWSVGITAHNFHRWLRQREQYGKYNVGWVTFRQDDAGRECLEWWYRKCLEWCHERVEPTRYADQKYLDHWPEQFRRVRVIANPGVNCAPWNLAGVRATRDTDGMIRINGTPLVFFHFADLAQVSERLYNTQLGACWVHCHGVVRDDIYVPYLQHLQHLTVNRLDGGLGPRVMGGVFLGAPVKTYARILLGVLLRQYIELPAPERHIEFVVADNGTHSGQFVASRMIHDYLDQRVWSRSFIAMPALERTKGRLGSAIEYLAKLPRAFWHILLSFRRTRVVLHLNLGQTKFALLRDSLPLIFLRAMRCDVQAVISLHGSNFLHWEPWTQEAIWLRRITEHARLLTVLSERQREKMVALGVPDRKLRVVLNCCENDGQSLAEVSAKQSAPGPVRILYLSSLIASKGYPIFLASLMEMSGRDGPSVEAVLCGRVAHSSFDEHDNAPWHSEHWIEQQVAEINRSGRIRLRWVRGADGVEKWDLYRQAQVFVFPSHYYVEAQPLVLIEAMAFGCAIVTSNVGEIPSMMTEQAAVRLDNPGAVQVTLELEQLVTDCVRRSALADAARRSFEARFTRRHYARAWSGIFDELWNASDERD